MDDNPYQAPREEGVSLANNVRSKLSISIPCFALAALITLIAFGLFYRIARTGWDSDIAIFFAWSLLTILALCAMGWGTLRRHRAASMIGAAVALLGVAALTCAAFFHKL